MSNRKHSCKTKPKFRLQLILLTSLAVVMSIPGFAQTTGGTSTGTGTTATTGTSGTTSTTPPAFTAAETALAPLTGQTMNGVLTFTFSRSDIQPVITGATGAMPALVFAGEVAFQVNTGAATTSTGTTATTNPVIMTAEIPLLSTELQNVVKSIDGSGTNIVISAIHNHVAESNPASVFMHLEGSGDATQLATAVMNALKMTAITLSASTSQSTLAGIDINGIESALGGTGTVSNGILDVQIPRSETFFSCVPIATSFATTTGTSGTGTSTGSTGTTTTATTSGGFSPESMAIGQCLAQPFTSTASTTGTTTAATTTSGVQVSPGLGAFSDIRIQPAGNNAIVAGELALLPGEIQPTIHALLAAGMQISAVHNHFTLLAPQLFFVHFAAVGNPLAISTQIRQVISANRIAAGQQP